MSNKKGKRNHGNKHFPIAESVSIALKIQLDKFLSDENETELKFPTFLSAQERGFIHETVAKLGLSSKSRGKGVNRFITIYKRVGSTIIQNDAKLILDSNMRCSITELFNAFPITSKEKEDLSSCPEKERSPQLTHKAVGQLNNGVAQIPSSTYNPDLIKFREKLPVYEQRQELLNAITHNQVIIVAGSTGSGKTTQLPQLVLEHCQLHKQPARIYCTQPRRISAVSVAERVAYERMEKIGQSIGYQIRLESRVSPRTVLTYCTNGLLLRTLMSTDSQLAGVTHVFVDEVHERDKFSDFLLIALRDALPRCKDLKLILMSATMDTQIFSRYFNNCPVITIPGRLHEVKRFYLEDVLRVTNYRTKRMAQVEKELKGKLKSGQSYWSQLEGAAAKGAEEGGRGGGGGGGGHEPHEPLEPALQADMDEFLEDCFQQGSLDSFCQILYMFLSEGVPASAAASRSRRTALMAAAAHGLRDTAAEILRIGADPSAKDSEGKTAYDHAVERGHTECAELLAGLSASPSAPSAPAAPDPAGGADDDADRFLLDVYHHSVPEDAVDHDLVLALVKHIHLELPKGAILIFLPGYDDIVAVRDLVQGCPEMGALKYQIFTLHSNMQTLDQRRVFNPLPSARKIIISTNIAETSITIDDVAYVVDSGLVKEKYYESSGGVSSLRRVWASRAAAEQRAGRAGRLAPGTAFHLLSRRRRAALPPHAAPELLRAPLQDLCLHTKLLAPGNTPIADFLSRAPDPPSFLAVRSAVALLKTIGALTPTEDLTEIGRHLLDLTVEPKLGKMLLYACVLKCLDPVLTIVCVLADREPFQISPSPESRRRAVDARRELAADSLSDHMALLRAFQAWQAARAAGAERAFCARNLVCGAAMEAVAAHRAQLLAQLRALGLVKARGSGDIKDVNLNSERWHVVKAALVSGLYPSLARVDREAGTLRTAREPRVALHPSSVLLRGEVGGAGTATGPGGAAVSAAAAGSRRSVRDLPADWVAFEEISRAGRLCFVRCCTLVTPLTVALLGGPLRLPAGGGALTQRANPPGLSSDSDSEADERDSSPDAAVLTLDDWTAFTADAADAIGVYYLRQKLSALVLRRMANPARPTTPLDEQILSTAVHVLGAEERNVGLVQPVGVGQRPKPLTVDAPGWRSRLDDDQPRPHQHHQQHQQHQSHQPHQPHQDYHQGPYQPNPYHRGGPRWGREQGGYSPQGAAPRSPMSPGGKALLANIEKYETPGEGNARYFVVRAEDAAALDNAQAGAAFPFPCAPQTQAKLLKAKQEGHQVVVFFSCPSACKFLGCAALSDAPAGGGGGGVAGAAGAAGGAAGAGAGGSKLQLDWLYTHHLPYHAVKHVSNSLAGGARAVMSADGAELCAAAARALHAALRARRRHHHHHPHHQQHHQQHQQTHQHNHQQHARAGKHNA